MDRLEKRTLVLAEMSEVRSLFSELRDLHNKCQSFNFEGYEEVQQTSISHYKQTGELQADVEMISQALLDEDVKSEKLEKMRPRVNNVKLRCKKI